MGGIGLRALNRSSCSGELGNRGSSRLVSDEVLDE